MMLELAVDGRTITDAPPLREGQWAELAATPPAGASLALEVGGVALEPFMRPGDARTWRWRWLAPAAAGAHQLRLRATWPDGRVEELRATLQVAPRKLDEERYAAILADLQRLGPALVFALAGGAQSVAAPPEPDPSPPTAAEELNTLFGAELARLAAAVTRLSRRPPDRLRAATETVELGRLQDSGRVIAVRPEHDEAVLAAPQPSYDSYETRLLRRLLDNLWRRLELLRARADLPPAAAAQADGAREQLRTLRGLPFLAGVPPLTSYSGPTARMQRDADYRVVYQVWRLLRRRPLISWDSTTLSIPVADLPRLYERWCVAATALAMLALPGWQVTAQRIVVDDGDEQLLSLPEDAPLVELAGPGGAALRLRYHPRYRPLAPGARGADAGKVGSLDRHTRVPDLALELVRPDVAPAVAVLDAKYRLDPAGGVPEEALADAYSYLGAIGTASGRATLGAALLYPGRGPAERYASGVAALPLLPGDDGALRAWLEGTLSHAPL